MWLDFEDDEARIDLMNAIRLDYGEIKNAVLIAAAVAASRPEVTRRVNTYDVLQALADV